jgi:hypothetical protein
MPQPRDNAKPTGEAEPPEQDNRAPAAADDDDVESTPGRGENQAGFLKDADGAGG